MKRRISVNLEAVISFLMRRSMYISNLTREAIYTRVERLVNLSFAMRRRKFVPENKTMKKRLFSSQKGKCPLS
jgi:hypothetical protein